MRLGFVRATASHHPVGKGSIDTSDINSTDSTRAEPSAQPPRESKEHYFKVFCGGVDEEVLCHREVSLGSADIKSD